MTRFHLQHIGYCSPR